MEDYKNYERTKRAVRRYENMKAQKRLYRKLKTSGCYKPSISCRYVYDYEADKCIYSGRIRRGKNSNQQKWMKKASARKIRNLKEKDIIIRGNGHRKYWDYWWTWI